jgi:iron complex transport system permease protein
MRPSRSRPGLLAWALLPALAALLLVSLTQGSTPVAPSAALAAVLGPLAAPLGLPAADPATETIVRDLRLPRALLAIVVGSGLALVGLLLQTVTRNDLADPYLFGLSSGAAAGAVAVITRTGELLGEWTLPLAAFGGGAVAATAVLALTRRVHGAGPERMVLAGLAVSFVFSALTHVMVFSGDQRAAHSVLFWTLGGLGLARWDTLPLALAGLALLAALIARSRHALDALLAGDDTAHSLGVAPQRLRTQVFLATALATASFVALTGVIGFVGLMVPHLSRSAAGVLHARAAPMAAAMGAVLLLGGDLIARTLLAPQELPVGIVTASAGACFVIAMLVRRTGR